MKKTLFRFLTGTILIAGFFTGCNFTFQANNLSTMPTVEAKDALISISIPQQSTDTKYINIYKKDTSDESENIINVGIIYPENIEAGGSSYIFHDTLIIKDTTYSYMVRYYDSKDEEYHSSEWSNPVTATGGYDSGTSLAYKINGASFSLTDDFLLKINGTILPPDITNFETEYTPMLIAKTADKTQAFTLTSIENGTYISLRGLFPNDFFDTSVVIEGIVAQKNEYAERETEDEDLRLQKLYWTEPTEIAIRGYSDKTVIIPSPAGSTGYDYSRKAAVK